MARGVGPGPPGTDLDCKGPSRLLLIASVLVPLISAMMSKGGGDCWYGSSRAMVVVAHAVPPMAIGWCDLSSWKNFVFDPLVEHDTWSKSGGDCSCRYTWQAFMTPTVVYEQSRNRNLM
jgi:hypothetical protein